MQTNSDLINPLGELTQDFGSTQGGRLEEEMKGQKTFEKKIIQKYGDLEAQYKELQTKYSEAKEQVNYMDNKLTEIEYTSKRLSTENTELLTMNESLKQQNMELMDFTLSNDNQSFIKKEQLSNLYNRPLAELKASKVRNSGAPNKDNRRVSVNEQQKIIFESIKPCISCT